jgi:hypothetical protein
MRDEVNPQTPTSKGAPFYDACLVIQLRERGLGLSEVGRLLGNNITLWLTASRVE